LRWPANQNARSDVFASQVLSPSERKVGGPIKRRNHAGRRSRPIGCSRKQTSTAVMEPDLTKVHCLAARRMQLKPRPRAPAQWRFSSSFRRTGQRTLVQKRLYAHCRDRALAESVPPKLYGGTERVVSWLTEALIDLNCDVTLFASGDSLTRAHLVSVCPRSLRLSRRDARSLSGSRHRGWGRDHDERQP
jgi:hypothetical protein